MVFLVRIPNEEYCLSSSVPVCYLSLKTGPSYDGTGHTLAHNTDRFRALDDAIA